MPTTRTYSPLPPMIPAGDIFCADPCGPREPDPCPHTYGVRLQPCDAFATEPCRPTACVKYATNLPSPSTDHRSLLGYRYVSPDGDGWAVVATAAHFLTQSPSDHCSLITVHSSYTFSAKERDTETGLSYFGARYYSSDLSIWLSVDSMSGKYPSLSPYVYCANNPVRLVDPNGDTVIAYDHFSKKMIRSYLKEIFGKNNLFRFSGYTLTINERHYEQYYQDASTDRQKLLDGFQDIITRSEKVIVKIVENKPSFVFEKSEAIRDENGVVIGGILTGEFTSLPNKGGGASSWGKRFSSYLLGVDNSVRDNLSTDDGGLTGNPAAMFTHELLDEVLNHYIYKRDNANSSKLDRVAFQNAALRTMNCKQRNGEDHE